MQTTSWLGGDGQQWSLWWILHFAFQVSTVSFPKAPHFPTCKGVSKYAEAFPPSQLPLWDAGPVWFLLSLSLFFSLSAISLLLYVEISLSFWSLKSSASIQKMICRSFFTCSCIFDAFVGRWSSCLTPLPSSTLPLDIISWCMSLPGYRYIYFIRSRNHSRYGLECCAQLLSRVWLFGAPWL